MDTEDEISPFHASLDTPLLDFGGEIWTTRDACEATCIVGAPGSGKSSASAKAIRQACFKAGFGALLACAKPEEAGILIAEIEALGRGDDVVVIDESATHTFNILDYAATHLGGPGFEQNIVTMMERMNEATRVASGKGKADGGGNNSFFVDAASKWLLHAFPILLAAEGTIRLKDVYDLITTAPKNEAEINTTAWQQSPCGRLHKKAYDKSRAGDAYADRVVKEHGLYFLKGEFPRLASDTRTSIEATLTNLITPFLHGKLAELFCADTTVTPDAAREGALIVLDLPALKFGPMGIVAQTMFKYLFGMAMQRERVTPETRPVMLYVDECHNFLATSDPDLLATARSAKVVCVFITQDYPTFFDKMGENAAKSILGKFGTRVFHANTSQETNLAAADLCGKVEKFHVGESVARTRTVGGGGNLHDLHSGFQEQSGEADNVSQSSSGYMDYEVPPDYFANKLRTGAERNNFKVDGIIVRTGRNWKRTGKHWIPAEFDQRG